MSFVSGIPDDSLKHLYKTSSLTSTFIPKSIGLLCTEIRGLFRADGMAKASNAGAWLHFEIWANAHTEDICFSSCVSHSASFSRDQSQLPTSTVYSFERHFFKMASQAGEAVSNGQRL
jgi:hypothetical protein